MFSRYFQPVSGFSFKMCFHLALSFKCFSQSRCFGFIKSFLTIFLWEMTILVLNLKNHYYIQLTYIFSYVYSFTLHIWVCDPFRVTVVKGVRPFGIFFLCDVYSIANHLLERLSIVYLVALFLCQRSFDCIYVGLFLGFLSCSILLAVPYCLNHCSFQYVFKLGSVNTLVFQYCVALFFVCLFFHIGLRISLLVSSINNLLGF